MKHEPLMPPHPSLALFDQLSCVAPYPDGVIAVPAQIQGTSFFPGGIGLWRSRRNDALPVLPIGGVMVVGQEFDTCLGYERSLANDAEDVTSPTWRHLISFLEDIPVPLSSCFFTNAFMGLRSSGSVVGRGPGWRCPGFLARCQAFFLKQVRVQRPRLILTLGAHVPRFLTPLSKALRAWPRGASLTRIDACNAAVVLTCQFIPGHTCVLAYLTHPCLRPANVWRRAWRGYRGAAAEVAMVRYALSESQRADPGTTV